MPGSFAIKLPQPDTKTIHFDVSGGYSGFDGIRANLGIGVETKNTLNNNNIFYTDTRICTGRTPGLKAELGLEFPLSDKVAADVSVYSGVGYRYADSKLPESVDDVPTNPTNSKWPVNAYENHLLYGGGAAANLKFKNDKNTWSVGFKGGYQGAHNMEGNKEGASFDLQNKSGWFAGIQAGVEIPVDKYMKIGIQAERVYTPSGPMNGIFGSVCFPFHINKQ